MFVPSQKDRSKRVAFRRDAETIAAQEHNRKELQEEEHSVPVDILTREDVVRKALSRAAPGLVTASQLRLAMQVPGTSTRRGPSRAGAKAASGGITVPNGPEDARRDQARILAFRRQEKRLRDALYANMASIERGLNQRARAAEVIHQGMELYIKRRLRRGLRAWQDFVDHQRRREADERRKIRALLLKWSALRMRSALCRWKSQIDRKRKAERAAMVAAASLVQRVWRGHLALDRVAKMKIAQNRERKVTLTLAYALRRTTWAKHTRDELEEYARKRAKWLAENPPSPEKKSRRRLKRRKRSRKKRPLSPLPVSESSDEDTCSISTEIADQEAGDAMNRIIEILEENERRERQAAEALAAARAAALAEQTLRCIMQELCEAVETSIECERALARVLGAVEIRHERARSIQHWIRGRFERSRFLRLRASAIRVETAWRSARAARSYRAMVCRVTVLQAFFRGCLARMRLAAAHTNALLLQCWIRKQLAIKYLQKLRREKKEMELRIARERVMEAKKQRRRNAAAIKIQAAARGFRARKRWAAQQVGAKRIQALVRGFLARCVIARLHARAVDIQRVFRGAWGRRRAQSRLAALVQIQAFSRRCVVRLWVARLHANATTIQCAYRSAKARYAAHLRRTIQQGEAEHHGCTELQRLWRGVRTRAKIASRKRSEAEARVREEYQTAYKSERLHEAWKRALKEQLEGEKDVSAFCKERSEEHVELIELRTKEQGKADQELASWQRIAPEVDGAIDGSDIYFYHSGYGASQWEAPEGFYAPEWDAQRKAYWSEPPDPNELRALNAGWMRIPSQDRRRVEYYNTWTGELSRVMPAGFQETRMYGGGAESDPLKGGDCLVEDVFDADDDLLREDEVIESILLCTLCRVAQADRRCKVCGPRLPYCFPCFLTSHTFRTWRVHETEIIKDADEDMELERWEEPAKVLPEEDVAQCTECRFAEATLICDQCGDQMCRPCFDELHAKGARKEHTWTEFHGFRWEEYFNEETNQPQYFNTETKEFTDECPLELMFGPDRHEYLQRMAKEKKAAAEAQRLAELTEEVEMLKEFREKSIAKDLELLKLQEEHNRAKSKTRKLAKFIAPSLMNDDVIEDKKLEKPKPKKTAEELEEEATLRAIRERRKTRRTQGIFGGGRRSKLAREMSQDPAYLKKLLNGKK